MQPQPSSAHLFVNHIVYTHRNKHFTPSLHRDFPLCDAEVGRPTLQLLKCYHLGCGESFTSGAALSNHLSLNSAYRRGFVKDHVEKYPLTTKLEKYCGICKLEFSSVDEMVGHLARMGIEGYWKKGETYQGRVQGIRKDGKTEYEVVMGQKEKVTSKFTLDAQQFEKVFQTEHCIICQDKHPDVLYQGCKHMNVCYNCYKLLQIRDTCVYCKVTSAPQLFKITSENLQKMKA